MKKRLAIIALAGAMTMSMLSGCSSTIDNEEIVATVGDEEISLGLANFYARLTQAQYETYYAGYLGDDMWSGEATEGKTYQEAVKEQVIGDLENMVLSQMHMEEYGVELTDEDQAAIEAAAKTFSDTNSSEDKEKVSGDEEIVKEYLTLSTIYQKVETAIKDTVDTEVSDEEAAQKSMQYVLFANTEVDETGASVELTEDELAEKKANAEKFAEEAKTAEDFEALAESYSAEAQTATFDAEEESSIPADLAKAADALGEGEVTDVIETDNGYYVAKVTSLFDEAATNTEKENIVAQRQQDEYDSVIDGWRDETDINVNEKVWKKVDFKELTVTIKIDETDPYTDELQTDDQAEESAE